MVKVLIYTALFGDTNNDRLREPKGDMSGCEFLCFTDRNDLESNAWKIIHEQDIPGFFTFQHSQPVRYTWKDPRIKARIIKTVLPVRIRFFNVTDFFDVYEDRIYIWMDASMRLKQNPRILVEEIMKDADIAGFEHPDRKYIEDEAIAAHKYRGADLPSVLSQVAAYKNAGFTKDVQKSITCTGFLLRKHTQLMEYFNLFWLTEILFRSERDQLSFDFCTWKFNLKVKHIPATRSYRQNPWVDCFLHGKIKK